MKTGAIVGGYWLTGFVWLLHNTEFKGTITMLKGRIGIGFQGMQFNNNYESTKEKARFIGLF